MIKHEMIKSALPILKKQIEDIFDIILKFGKFPCSWMPFSYIVIIRKLLEVRVLNIITEHCDLSSMMDCVRSAGSLSLHFTSGYVTLKHKMGRF